MRCGRASPNPSEASLLADGTRPKELKLSKSSIVQVGSTPFSHRRTSGFARCRLRPRLASALIDHDRVDLTCERLDALSEGLHCFRELSVLLDHLHEKRRLLRC